MNKKKRLEHQAKIHPVCRDCGKAIAQPENLKNKLQTELAGIVFLCGDCRDASEKKSVDAAEALHARVSLD